MRHNVKKIKFNFGQDANQMLMRKLAVSFLAHGYLETTLKRAKTLKSHLDKLVTKMKSKSEANKNFLLRYLGNINIVEDGFKRIGPVISKVSGGYVRLIKLGARISDGSQMARVEWTTPIINEESKKIVKKVETKEKVRTLPLEKKEEKKTKK